MPNSVDPDQTAPLGAVWSGSALFAQTYLSENLGSLWQLMAWFKLVGKEYKKRTYLLVSANIIFRQLGILPLKI